VLATHSSIGLEPMHDESSCKCSASGSKSGERKMDTAPEAGIHAGRRAV
jgi:hypothetical protein